MARQLAIPSGPTAGIRRAAPLAFLRRRLPTPTTQAVARMFHLSRGALGARPLEAQAHAGGLASPGSADPRNRDYSEYNQQLVVQIRDL